jgi:hypothetical protein
MKIALCILTVLAIVVFSAWAYAAFSVVCQMLSEVFMGGP